MSDDNTQINLLVLSAENDFQLKMINTNLQDIATQLNQLNGNIRNLETIQDRQISGITEKLNEINKNLYEFVYDAINFKK